MRGDQAPADATLTPNLNGHRLTRILNGSERLIRGRDYTVRGNEPTIKGATLARLTEDQGNGVKATLSLQFNRGVPWDVNVITYETPRYKTSPARPAAWPSRPRSPVTGWPPWRRSTPTAPTPARMTGPRSRSSASPNVTLTFHFWSGETITYALTRSGSTVTGTAS